jgi:hypothetical protein
VGEKNVSLYNHSSGKQLAYLHSLTQLEVEVDPELSTHSLWTHTSPGQSTALSFVATELPFPLHILWYLYNSCTNYKVHKSMAEYSPIYP